MSAICPESYCDFTTDQTLEHLLPSNSSEDPGTNSCNPNREGTLCGVCKTNHSAYYRSMSFSCKPDDLYFLGWLFYILTELVPVTILFLVVIFFNISFTSGPLNGVVFFMQVMNTLKLDADNLVRTYPQILTLAKVHKFVYRIFMLNVFAIEEFSFCLWSGATALDMLAFRYVTITYSLFLVIATVFLLKICRRTSFNLQHSITNGLSTFFIMSYSECARVSLMILTMGKLRVGPENQHSNLYVAFYKGDYSYMGPEHLKYALPAIFNMTMVLIPPLLLISYPLCYKLFALLRIEESRFVQITCKIFPLEKMKPLFDSVQGTFKDRYRFFAGLYFMYRFSMVLTFTMAPELIVYYLTTEALLILILISHVVCRPYRTTWPNVLDTILLMNLAIINAMALMNYQFTYNHHTEITVIISGFQVTLVLLPLVYLVVYTTYHIVKRIKAACTCKSTGHNHEDFNNTNEVIDNLDRARYLEMNNYRLLRPESNAVNVCK